jgi:broad specificity phosphatase PhoE
MLFLVRHGRPCRVPGVRPDQWDLDPERFDDIWALRESGRLPRRAVWFSSPEPKAVATAQLLTDEEVGVIDDLREHVRDTTDWLDDFAGTVRRAFAQPAVPAYDGWEPLAQCRERTARAFDGIRSTHPDDDVVLVGHGTAWTLLASELTGEPPDLDRWAALQMPDVIVLDA